MGVDKDNWSEVKQAN